MQYEQDAIRDADEFERWLRHSGGGAERQYWEGFLMADRTCDLRAELVGRTAWNAYKRGEVLLYQYKLNAGRYLYFARRIRRKRK